MNTRKKLTDILEKSTREKIGRIWDSTKAAADLKPLPSGEYRCRVAGGELFNASTGTPGYRIKLVVVDGDHTDQVVWHDLWLSEAALPITKRDLGKIGITNVEQLERPLPDTIIVLARIALQKREDGTEVNRVMRLEIVPSSGPSEIRSRRRGTRRPSVRRKPKASTGDPKTAAVLRDSMELNGEQEDPPAGKRGRGAYGKK